MKHTLHKLLDVIFPPRESQKVVRDTQRERTTHTSGCHEGIFYCAEYSDPFIHAAIVENKFYNNPQAQTILADQLTEWISSKHVQDICFLPIPLGKERLKSRGHNQVVSILQKSSFTYNSKILTRVIETVPQASMDRQHRLHNIKNVFSCDIHGLQKLHFTTFILLDDVVTTGATLNEARATLAPHLPPGTKLICLALTH